MTEISVIIACLNGEATLAETLGSLAAQRWDRPWEIVFADNGSTDASRAIFLERAARHPQVAMRLVDASARRGKAHALNLAIRAAAGRSLLFCDADDTVAPGWLAAMGRALETHDLVAARFDLRALNPDWTLAERPHDPDRLAVLPFEPFCPVAGGATLGFRREVFAATGDFDPAFAALEDTDFCIRAHLAGFELVFVPELMADIEAFFRARRLPVSPSNRKQAHVPQGAIPLRNPVGTAPCFIVEVGERSLTALPGVPREMEYLLLDRVLPYLRERYRLQEVIVSRLVRVAGLGESRVGELLGDFMTGGANPTVGTMAHLGQVDVRIAAKARNEAAARALIAPVETGVRQRLGDVVFGVDGDTLEGVVAAGLIARGLTLALLEAGTGGLVAERLTAVGGGAERVQALVVPDVAAAARLGLGDGAGARLAEMVRDWGRSDVGAACLLGPAEGEGPSRLYPTRIAVAGPAGLSEHEQRFVGDLRQARVRAQVSVLDCLRRALAASGA